MKLDVFGTIKAIISILLMTYSQIDGVAGGALPDLPGWLTTILGVIGVGSVAASPSVVKPTGDGSVAKLIRPDKE